MCGPSIELPKSETLICMQEGEKTMAMFTLQASMFHSDFYCLVLFCLADQITFCNVACLQTGMLTAHSLK